MKHIILTLFLVLSTSFSYASCDSFYPGNKKIEEPQTIELCNSFFVSVFSTKHNGVLFSSEILTPGLSVTRADGFSADKRLPKKHRHSPADYSKSGFDRGHLVPAADARNNQQMEDTFFLSNVAPQEPTLNRKAWKELEEMIRRSTREPTIIITGVLYEDKISGTKTNQHLGKNDIPVPVAFFKIVYKIAPLTAPIGYYVVNNVDAKPMRITVDGINKRSGYNLPIEN